jgi:hypothetical protein
MQEQINESETLIGISEMNTSSARLRRRYSWQTGLKQTRNGPVNFREIICVGAYVRRHVGTHQRPILVKIVMTFRFDCCWLHDKDFVARNDITSELASQFVLIVINQVAVMYDIRLPYSEILGYNNN